MQAGDVVSTYADVSDFDTKLSDGIKEFVKDFYEK